MKYNYVNSEAMKILNMQHILKTIIANQPISRAKISTITDLHKVTVSNCVDYLLEKGLLEEMGTTGTSRGRPPTLVRIDGSAGICVGIDVDTNEYHILVTDISGKHLEHSTFPLIHSEPDYFIQSVSEIIHSLIAKYSHYKLGIVGVGIAISGFYNSKSETIEYIANLQSWNQFPIKKELKKAMTAIPFFIDTAAAAGVMGEIHFGKFSASEQFVYVGGRWGLVVAAYTDGKIVRGKYGFTGRMGHITIHMNGKKCTCGNKGCWEVYSSVKALYELIDPINAANKPHLPFSEILKRIEEQDPAIQSAIYEIGHYLGIGLVNVVNTYTPSSICIGGYLGMIGAPLLKSIRATLEEKIPKYFLENLNLFCSELGEGGGAYGAISFVIDNFSDIFINGETM